MSDDTRRRDLSDAFIAQARSDWLVQRQLAARPENGTTNANANDHRILTVIRRVARSPGSST
jgi:hypothetical protein